MGRDDVEVGVGAKWTGDSALKRAAAAVSDLGRGLAQGVQNVMSSPLRFTELSSALNLASQGYQAVSNMARQAWAAMEQGAQLQTTIQRFDKLSESINTTSDALLGKLREATQGMISDAQLMASASKIMSLGLADNEQQVTRLATVSGLLGWDMQQVILTFANLSTMRLDTLGLGVDDIRRRAKELEQQGLSTAEAFKEAVIQAGEAKLDIGGVSEAEQSLKQATAAVANFKNELLLSGAATLDQAGAFDALSSAAANMNLMGSVREQLAQMRADGELTLGQWLHFQDMIAGGSSAAAIQVELDQIAIRDALTDTDDELNLQAGAWQLWARQVSISTGYAAQQVAAAANDIFFSLAGIRDGLGDNAPFMPGLAEQFDYLGAGAQAGRASQQQQALLDQRDEVMRQAGQPGSLGFMYGQQYGGWDGRTGEEARRGFDEAGEAARGYGRALSYVDEEAQKAAEAQQRFMSTFNAELQGDAAGGLINAEGVVNVEAMNQALYRQVEAAGASAATLALLGIATGQFSEEQAEAALKAAILQEQINQIAESVVSGKITLEQALASIGEASANLNQADLITVAQGVTTLPEAERTVDVEADTSGAEAAVTNVQTSLAVLTDEPYLTTLDMDIQAVLTGTQEATQALDAVPDIKTVTINWSQAGVDVITALRALGIMP